VLTQPGLIKQAIEAVGFKDGSSVHTPALPESLGSDINGKVFSESWSYSSVVGFLMYLANNTRPDIAYATNQCKHFTHAARHYHAQGIKQIVQ
jgi:hypothetical protein